jgi:hypothetical protein
LSALLSNSGLQGPCTTKQAQGLCPPATLLLLLLLLYCSLHHCHCCCRLLLLLLLLLVLALRSYPADTALHDHPATHSKAKTDTQRECLDAATLVFQCEHANKVLATELGTGSVNHASRAAAAAHQ